MTPLQSQYLPKLHNINYLYRRKINIFQHIEVLIVGNNVVRVCV